MLGVLPAATIEQRGAGLQHAEFAAGGVVFDPVPRRGAPDATTTNDGGAPLAGSAEGSAG